MLTLAESTLTGSLSAALRGDGLLMSVRDSLITGNGTVVVSSWGTVCDRCILTGHRDPDYGPLGATVDATWVSVADCALIGNAGDAIRGDGSYSQATNCTVADNAGNGMEVDYLPTTNCIFWGNFPPQIVSTANPPEVTYSDVQGGWPGSSNLDANPQFPVIAGGSWSQAGEYRLTTFQLTLTDSNAAWTAGGLVGYFVRPDPTSPFHPDIPAIRLSFGLVAKAMNWSTRQRIERST